ncbi:uncharacterized protein LOC118188683 [Stegodyphus dumicola]|uniref:uncharacterized protein LOC118188683 n=1 Tax=Stegodyphus dumicola TaxID=202533 RepID=UPI0015A796D7|nr:uncharacterized protein LOC118188683 [Stegodyphus dumicola]
MVAYEAAQMSHVMPYLKSWQSKLVPPFLLVLHLTRIIVLSLKGQNFIDESNNLSSIFSSCEDNSFSEEAKFQIEELLLKEKYFPVTLTAYEFMSLSKAFLATVIGTLLTYLIILIQLTPDPCE